MKIPFLGKVRMHWCNICQIPLIRKGCSRCGVPGIRLNLTPPGDIRPAFSGDITRIILAIKNQFGQIFAEKFSHLVKNQILLLNKVPYIDRMDEIYFLGKPIGLFRFNPLKEDFEFVPKLPLAKLLWHQEAGGWIDVDIGAKIPIEKGASVLVPGVLNVHGKIRVNDPTIVVCQNQVIAVGLAKMDSETMRSSSRGVAVKTKYRKFDVDLDIHPKEVNWNDIIAANQDSLNKIEQEAINFIEKVGREYKTCVVAYSGGKDSLVTLNLVAQSDVPYEIIFADTGLEYPETIDNIKLIGTHYNRNVLTADNPSWDFWERFDQFGPPSRNSRWCCKSSKLAPINLILENNFPNDSQVLTYIGKRRYESLGRSLEPRVSQNPWIPKQISASPINNWNAFEVYLYIHAHKLMNFLNPLYSQGFIRIGCWVCPASSLADIALMETSHPNLLNILVKKLEKIRSKYNLPSQYISWGLWRWKILPTKVINLLKSSNVSFHRPHVEPNDSEELNFHMTKSASTCMQGGFSIFLSSNKLLELEKISNLLPILGEIQYNKDLDFISVVDSANSRSDIFRDGSLIVRDGTSSILDQKALTYIKTIYRVTYCDKCTICVYNCTEEALSIIDEGIMVNSDKCIECLICNDYCPLIRYDKSSKFVKQDS